LKGPAQFTGNWELMAVAEAKSPHLEHFTGQTIAAIARQQGKDGVDALLDLAIEDNLQTEFALAFLNTNQEGVASLLRTPGTVLGLSDGGAHLGVLCDAGYPTYLLGHWVRERRALSIEHAVMRLTSEPARLLGLRDRGQIAEGMAADLAIFDPATVGSDERAHKRFDLPGGAKRFVMPSRGMHYTIVGGEPVFENGEDTGARPGVHLRS
jgi:N-acyl-D-aspartate/D-glutamate deacylase